MYRLVLITKRIPFMKLSRNAILVLLLLSAYSALSIPVIAQEGPVLQLAVAVAPLAGIVDDIGGSYVETTVLLPEGIEPHASQLPQSSVEAANNADLLILTGHFPWEEDLINQTGKPYISLEDYEDYGAELSPIPGDAEHEEDGHDHEDGNPHSYWLLPKNARAIANATRSSLSELYPSLDWFWQSMFDDFVERIERFLELVGDTDDELGFSSLKAVVVFPAEAYVAEAFGIEVVGVLQEGENVFISGAELLQVQLALANGTIDLIIGSDIARLQAGGEFARQLGEDTSTQVVWWRVIFFSGMSDYLSVMTYNLGAISSALESEQQRGINPIVTYALVGLASILAIFAIAEAVLLLRKSSID
ncbi:zinc ABC transporter substrate-binding protein [Candidatus Thorarchaeota archaeon]|nr:MAG: zinc ABC transporter substrate-binding protein [Candidatus Thorarchaeota archaeon]